MIFFMGISPDKTEQRTVVVVIQRYLKNIQKHYEPVHIMDLPFPMTDPALEGEITRLYRDHTFTLNKKIFSQDRRPTKTVRAHPRLVLNRKSGEDRVKGLRGLGIPVEGILPVAGSGSWIKHSLGKALGDDYDVPERILLESLVQVHGQKRLVFQEGFRGLTGPMEDLKGVLEDPGANPEAFFSGFAAPVLPALSLVLWFNETVPYQRAYKA
jgi:hypothetical protein